MSYFLKTSFNSILDRLQKILNSKGKSSVLLKKEILKDLINQTNGEVLKLFDSKFKKKLNVNTNTIAKIIATDSCNEDISLEEFNALNTLISEQKGASSVSKKEDLLKQIYSKVDKSFHYLLSGYYESGLFKIGLNQKIALSCLLQLYPDNRQYIKSAEKSFRSFWLYEIYKACKENNLILEDRKIHYKPMLASPFDKKRFKSDTYYAEPKYDGFRVLVKKEGQNISYWTRSGECLETENFLKIIEPFTAKLISFDKDLVLDGQIWLENETAFDCFRLLSPLVKTKSLNQAYYDKYASKIRYTIFDILELQQRNLMLERYSERRKLLEGLEIGLDITKCYYVKTLESMEDLFQEVIKNYEGLIIKHKDSVYETNKRSLLWMKKKPIKQTLDVQVYDFKKGTGKYQEIYASFTLGVAYKGYVLTIGNIGSGFKEEDLQLINDYISKKKNPIVLEVVADSITKSEKYTSGYALRFPRLIRIRPDKSEPDSLDKLLKIYEHDLH